MGQVLRFLRVGVGVRGLDHTLGKLIWLALGPRELPLGQGAGLLWVIWFLGTDPVFV